MDSAIICAIAAIGLFALMILCIRSLCRTKDYLSKQAESTSVRSEKDKLNSQRDSVALAIGIVILLAVVMIGAFAAMAYLCATA